MLLNKCIFKPKRLNVLVLGSNGMLGYELHQRLLELSGRRGSGIGIVVGLDKDSIDVTERYALADFFGRSVHFDYCVNCAAYTNTNAAQTTSEGRELDYGLNALAPKYIAEACRRKRTKLIHVSTDYVFSEMSPDAAWGDCNSPLLFGEESVPFPRNVYGYDKLIGELNIRDVFGKDSTDYCIMRVSWLYGMHNSKSFVHKFVTNLVKAAKEGKTEIEMTSNERSVPTSCQYAVDRILDIMREKSYGIYHAVPSCGVNAIGVSRLEFADKILQFLKSRKFDMSWKNSIDFSGISLIGVERHSYWPKHSAMKASAYRGMSWDGALDGFLNENAKSVLEWANANAN